MSSGVSQINYWISGSSLGAKGPFNANEGGPGASYLSYNMFLGLSVLGGFLALDHLYLRSPLTFIAKLIVNLLFFGLWWLYDASQAIFNTEVVKVFGLGIPGLGPKGIGAGVLAKDVPDKKHMAFFVYGLALFFGGIIGLDSFLVGDQRSGLIRLVSFITIIAAPVAILWWLYNVFYFVFKTKEVTDQYSDYFGSPSSGFFSSLGKQLASIPIIGPLLQTSTILKPVFNTVQAGIHTVDSAVSTVKQGLELGKTAVEKGASLADHAITTAGDTAKAASSVLGIIPTAATFSQEVTPPAVQKVLSEQQGGSIESGILPYVFAGTIGLVAVSGFVLTYLRSKKNVSPPKNDSPPEPGILRESDKKESTRSP